MKFMKKFTKGEIDAFFDGVLQGIEVANIILEREGHKVRIKPPSQKDLLNMRKKCGI